MHLLCSQPERFTLPLPPGAKLASTMGAFDIPLGDWVSASWHVSGHVPSGVRFVSKSVAGDSLAFIERPDSRESYLVYGAAGDATVQAIRAAAGGRFPVEMIDEFAAEQPEGGIDIVVSCTLTLVDRESEQALGTVGRRFTMVYDAAFFRGGRKPRTGPPGGSVGRITTLTYEGLKRR